MRSTQESFTKFEARPPVGLETPEWRAGDAGECCTYHLPHTATPAALAATEPNSGTAWTHAWSVCPFGPPSFPAFPFRDFKTSSSSIPSPLFRSQSQLQMQNGNADSNSTSSSPNPRFPLLTALNPNARYNNFPSPSNGQFLRLTKSCNDLSGVWTIEDCPTRNMRWDVRERLPNPNVSHEKGRWSSFQVLTWQVRWQRPHSRTSHQVPRRQGIIIALRAYLSFIQHNRFIIQDHKGYWNQSHVFIHWGTISSMIFRFRS